MREVVNPHAARLHSVPGSTSIAEQIETSRAETESRLEIARLQLVKAFRGTIEKDRQTIRMQAALSLPNLPMTPEQVQLWLDERCIGVARYMKTGKIL